MNTCQLIRAARKAWKVSGWMAKDTMYSEYRAWNRWQCFKAAFSVEHKSCKQAPALGLRY